MNKNSSDRADCVMDDLVAKVLRDGAESLTDAESVALTGGTDTYTAQKILASGGGIPQLAAAAPEIFEAGGLDPGGAARLAAAVDLGRRTLRTASRRVSMRGPRQIATYLLPRYGHGAVERIGVLLLNHMYHLIEPRLLSSGVVDSCLCSVADLYRPAMARGARFVVLFHNHPSGSVEPSPDDAALTTRVAAAGDVLGIELLDHLILSAGAGYYSFRENGRI